MTRTAKPVKCKQSDNTDLIYTFKYVCMTCHINNDVPQDVQQKIHMAVKQICKEIWIDKSYVEFKENKHEDTFMLEEGWNELCNLVIQTNCGEKATKQQNAMMQEAFCLMIVCYVYLFLENLGYDADDIYLEINPESRFMVQYEEDKIKEWKYYPGKWQTWNWDEI